jgi:hypothetical protein
MEQASPLPRRLTKGRPEKEVWCRAGSRCEYCHVSQAFYCVPFQIDHIIAEQHGGPTFTVW